MRGSTAQHGVVRSLDQPLAVILAPRPQPDAVRVQHDRLQPRLDRLSRDRPPRARRSTRRGARRAAAAAGGRWGRSRTRATRPCGGRPSCRRRPATARPRRPDRSPSRAPGRAPGASRRVPCVGVQPEPELRDPSVEHPEVDRTREPPLVLDREAVRRVVGPPAGTTRWSSRPRRPRRTATARSSTRPTRGPGTARRSAARRRLGGPATSRRRRSGSVPRRGIAPRQCHRRRRGRATGFFRGRRLSVPSGRIGACPPSTASANPPARGSRRPSPSRPPPRRVPGSRSARVSTPSSWPPPARARRSARSCGRSTGC